MHASSFRKLIAFRECYLAPLIATPLTILDVGARMVEEESSNLDSPHRKLLGHPPWRYLGLDVAPGANVDIVVAQPYAWSEIAPASVDVVVSDQALEHIERFWLTIGEIDRALKPRGLVCLVAPSRGPEHRFPVDCWRFYPDGFRALAALAGWRAIEVGTDWKPGDIGEGSLLWGDTTLIAQKPPSDAAAQSPFADMPARGALALARQRSVERGSPLQRRTRTALGRIRAAMRALRGHV